MSFTIPEGEGVLITVSFDNILGPTTQIDESSIFLSYPGGQNEYISEVLGLPIEHPSDCSEIYYGNVLPDCLGVCGGGAQIGCNDVLTNQR